MTVRGAVAEKPASLVAPDEAITVAGSPRRFVSRGGDKLDAAIDRSGVAVEGRWCLDAGASTGGFTDCLLRRGAAAVAAVDVGYGQLAWELRTDPRVTVLERTNVRDLKPDDLPFRPELLVADLSFISLRTILPTLAGLASQDAALVLLVKPQFEAGPRDVGRGGVVRDPDVWRRVLLEVADAAADAGLAPQAIIPSPLLGPAGNAEFFRHAARGGGPSSLGVESAIEEASRTGRAS